MPQRVERARSQSMAALKMLQPHQDERSPRRLALAVSSIARRGAVATSRSFPNTTTIVPRCFRASAHREGGVMPDVRVHLHGAFAAQRDGVPAPHFARLVRDRWSYALSITRWVACSDALRSTTA
jgi:hypothetical protein